MKEILPTQLVSEPLQCASMLLQPFSEGADLAANPPGASETVSRVTRNKSSGIGSDVSQSLLVKYIATPRYVARFWRRVDMSAGPDGCWPWRGTKHEGGYGLIRPRSAGRRQHQIRATHVLLALVRGEYALGREALHDCDNPPCLNPKHVKYGTHAENMADMARKGRAYSGYWLRSRASS